MLIRFEEMGALVEEMAGWSRWCPAATETCAWSIDDGRNRGGGAVHLLRVRGRENSARKEIAHVSVGPV
jgi:hypothetical protein